MVKVFGGDFFLGEIQLQAHLCADIGLAHDGGEQLNQTGTVKVFHLLLLLQLSAGQTQGGFTQHLVHQGAVVVYH